MMRVAVVGLGPVGLVTAACLASWGHQVFGVDSNQDRIKCLLSREVPFFEPGLIDLVRQGIDAGRLVFTTSYQKSLEGAQVAFICVGTPPLRNGKANLSQFLDAAGQVGRYMTNRLVIAIKSTALPGTYVLVQQRVLEQQVAGGRHIPFSIVCNPEFIREGSALSDFMAPSYVVIGGSDHDSVAIVRSIYSGHVPDDRILTMDLMSAQMAKYAVNCFLAARISLINEFANLCDQCGADIDGIRAVLGRDPRIGPEFLQPGIGYGGSCLPKDVMAIYRLAQENGYQAQMLLAIDRLNRVQRLRLVKRMEQALRLDYPGSGLSGKTVGIWGLAFKPGTDDIRESPALNLINDLRERGVALRVYDPVANASVRRVFGDVLLYSRDPLDCVRGAHAVVLATEWPIFRTVDLRQVSRLMIGRHLFDGRNALNPVTVEASGLVYHGAGRSRMLAPEGGELGEDTGDRRSRVHRLPSVL